MNVCRIFGLWVLVWSTGAGWLLAEPSREIRNLAAQPIPHSSYLALRGRVELPAEGVWHVRSAASNAVVQLYLIPPPDVGQRQLGRRAGAALHLQRIEQGRWKVSMAYNACRDHARHHEGRGPQSAADLDRDRYEYVIENLQKSPWRDLEQTADNGQSLTGPFVFIVPNARFHFADDQHWRIESGRREILAVELRPYVDDGQHWVLYTDRTCLRQPINAALVERHGLEIRPVAARATPPPPQTEAQYQVVVVQRDSTPGMSFELTVFNPISGDERVLLWPGQVAERDSTVLDSLRKGRQLAWQPYLRTGPAPVLRTWLATEASDPGEPPGDAVNMFALLGGRAAIEETLQLQNLAPRESNETELVDVSSLRGVTVQAHPYEKMLAGREGGQLTLAHATPTDRFFLYAPRPEAILPFLDHGAGFLAAAGAGLTGNRLDYGLTDRYLTRFGLTREQLDAVLRSGMVRELAVLLPDLFLIEGTDMTVVARLAQPQLVAGLMQLLGVRGLGDGHLVTVPTASGGTAHWALRGDLVCLSTQQGELERVLELLDHDGEGSLGRSAEFRYMLTQLPVRPQTRLFAYFSDPFVRRLVGPHVKLGQLRRLKARAQLEVITAQAIQARLDGVVGPASVEQFANVEQLVSAGYLPDSTPSDEYSIDSHGIVHSETYGSLPGSRTLLDVPVERVTPAEAEAYGQYVENYSRYWRQFFDPIAIRLDDADEETLELSTFILPLIDNSVYNRLREVLVHQDDRQALAIPRVEPAPVLQFSINLSDQSWQQTAGGFADFFRRFGGVSPALLDDLGSGLHLAVFDADPVIALGSGDVMGAFGGNVLQRGGNEMVMIPVALSLLTRPCSIYIETGNPERTARYLRQAASAWMAWSGRNDDDFRVSFYQVGDQDSWVWTMSIAGIIKLRFGVEVSGQYLVIRNIPWSTTDRIVRIEEAPLNGAGLTVTPGALRLQLPGLFASASDQERRATMAGLGRLYPLVLSGLAGADTAGQIHFERFGFRPLHPAGGQWEWEDWQLVSTTYGAPWRQRQPAFDPARPFGLLQAIAELQLTMQFEKDGLRSQIRWKWNAP